MTRKYIKSGTTFEVRNEAYRVVCPACDMQIDSYFRGFICPSCKGTVHNWCTAWYKEPGAWRRVCADCFCGDE